MDSYMKRQQWLARIQAIEVGKLFTGSDPHADATAVAGQGMPARAANGARYVSPGTMMKTLGVLL